MFAGAVTALSCFWGGSQNLVFPLRDDLADHDLFWALVDRLDADRFLLYNGAVADLEYLAPGEYAAGRQGVEQSLDGHDQEIVRVYLGDWREGPLVEAEAPEGLEELLIRRVAPLNGEPASGLLPFGGMGVPYPFADVGQLADLPQPVVDPATPLGDTERLLLAVEVGRCRRVCVSGWQIAALRLRTR